MRELPEPDCTAEFVGTRWPDAYSYELVLAIQRQAYEDGLRNAAQICDELAEINRKAMTDSMWQQEECAAAIRTRAMLTASQKEAE